MGLNGLGLDCGLLALFEFAATETATAGEAIIFGLFDNIEDVTDAAGGGGTILALAAEAAARSWC